MRNGIVSRPSEEAETRAIQTLPRKWLFSILWKLAITIKIFYVLCAVVVFLSFLLSCSLILSLFWLSLRQGLVSELYDLSTSKNPSCYPLSNYSKRRKLERWLTLCIVPASKRLQKCRIIASLIFCCSVRCDEAQLHWRLQPGETGAFLRQDAHDL